MSTTTSVANTTLQRPASFRRLSTIRKRRFVRSTSTCSSESVGQQHQVRFNKKVQTKECLHVNDMEPEEIASCWFLPDECQPSFKDTDCFRGLEQMTREGMAKQLRNTREAIDAVLHEQARQRYKGESDDPSVIAAIYIQKTRHCRTEARKWGVLDAHDAGIPIDQVVASIKEQKKRNSISKRNNATTIKKEEEKQHSSVVDAEEDFDQDEHDEGQRAAPPRAKPEGEGPASEAEAEAEAEADKTRRVPNITRRGRRDSITKKLSERNKARKNEQNSPNSSKSSSSSNKNSNSGNKNTSSDSNNNKKRKNGSQKRRNYFKMLVRRAVKKEVQTNNQSKDKEQCSDSTLEISDTSLELQ